MLNSQFPGLEWAISSQGLWLRTQAWQKRKMFWVWNSKHSPVQHPCPTAPPTPSPAVLLVLTCRQLSCPPIRRVCGGWGEKGKKTQTFHLGCSHAKEKLKASDTLPDMHLWDAILPQHPLCRGKGIRQDFDRNSRMWSTYLSQHQEA